MPTSTGSRGLKCVLKDIDRFSHKDLQKILDLVKVYFQESHHSRKLYRCKECGQLYLYEFNEEVDYVGGNDPQFYRYVPVEDEAAAELLSKAPQLEVECRYGIHIDWPSDAESPGPPHWSNVPKPTQG